MDKISVTPDPKNELYSLDGDYHIKIGDRQFDIPDGFQFDGASIPSIFWIAIYSPYNPKVLRAALVHDYLYATQITTRKYADDTFRDLLAQCHVTPWRRRAMWLAVRWFGWIYWMRGKRI